MSAKRLLFRPESDRPARTSRLDEIARVLGTTPRALASAARQPGLTLHADADEGHWFVRLNHGGAPVVGHVSDVPGDTDRAEVGVATFLAGDPSSPAHRALVALIEDLLTRHLGG